MAPPIPTWRSGRSCARASTACAAGSSRRRWLDRDPAELDASEAERYGVGAGPRTLEDALRALAEDEVLRGSLGPTLYEAYAGLKQAECDAVAGWDLGETCRRYVQIY
jgi:glutamine synthetase